jgi:hypothetical protein
MFYKKNDMKFHYSSVSQPPGHGPELGPGINFTGPSSYKKRIYQAVVSQRLRTTALETVQNLHEPIPRMTVTVLKSKGGPTPY